MKFKVQSSKFKVQSRLRKVPCVAASPFLRVFLRVILFLLTVHCLMLTSLAQNDLRKIADGGFVQNWLVSNSFPAEIDAGAWENFNRFNIECLPEKDWLAPFGGARNIKPRIGTFKATVQIQLSENPKSKIQSPKSGAPLPEVGAASNIKTLPDAAEISWREARLENPNIDFFSLNNGKNVGTAYAASYIDSINDEIRFVATGGFLGSIWLNGEKIYDGFVLNAPGRAIAKFRKGANLLLVRASGISGDYWRKNGGFSALLRFWNSEASLNQSLAAVSNPANGTIFYLEGFHVDPVYLQDQRGYSRITLSNMNQYIQSLRADPQYGVYLSEIDYLKPYLDTHPEDREFLRGTVRQGRVGTGGSYNQFNETTIGGESIVRNILYGQAMHEAMLGRRAKSLALWDVFGHAPQISQIARKSGFTGITWSKKIGGFNPFFYDYALDGSRLLHRRVDYAYSFSGFGSGKNYTIDNFIKTTERKFQETQTFGSMVDLRINAADFTPPWTNLAGNVEKLEANKPQIKVTGQAQDLYFDALNREIAEGKTKPPVTSRDKLFFHVGVMAARSDLKIGQRLSENMTLTAEKFGAIAYLRGAKYPDLALDKAWRQIFFGSHHDAITGTPSDSAFLDLVHGYREAFELSKGALDDSLNYIARQIETKPKFEFVKLKPQIIPIVVFNPTNWKRNDVVRVKVDGEVFDWLGNLYDAGGTEIVFSPNYLTDKTSGKVTTEIEFVASDVPSLGYKTFFIVPKGKPNLLNEQRGGTEKLTANIIQNEFYRITVDETHGGAISSIYDKQAKREIINIQDGHFANEIGVLKEELTKKNVIYPAWEFWTTGEKKFSTETSGGSTTSSVGSTQTLEVSGRLPNMRFYRQTIELHKGIKRIDFKTELIDYKGKDELFVVNFPLNLAGGALVTEDRFGTVVRNNSKGFLDFRTNTDKLTSGAPVYAVNNWAEYGSTFNLNFLSEPSASAGGLSSKNNNARMQKNGEEPKIAALQIVASVPFKPTALIRPHGENYEQFTETIVANLIKRGVSVTPFYDDDDEPRRKNLSIEDSTMPRKLNDDIAYHGFRIALGGERENLYSAGLLKQVSAETRAKFDARLARDGFAFLFVYDKEVPEGWRAIPTLLIAGDVEKAVEKFVRPIQKGSSTAQPSTFKNADDRAEYESLDTFSISLPLESFAAETNPNKDLPRVPDYGVALINHGTPAVSLENPNTLTLFLTHTAMFPGVNLPFEFVPENKTHVFNYALYPHTGSWREADTVKSGEDFNNPLIAVQPDVHDGDLPSEKSFLSVAQSNIVLSSLKMGGNPQADFKNEHGKNNDLRPVIMRFYETEGIKTDAKLDFNLPNYFYLAPKNLLEKADGAVLQNYTFRRDGVTYDKIDFDNFSIRTFGLHPSHNNLGNYDKKNPQIIGATKEIVQPVFSRYWLHNSGAAPIGNDAVKVSLRRVEQMNELSTFAYDDKYNQGGTTTVAVRVQVVNNYQDRNYKGEVVLDVPEDWRVVPDKLQFDIAPNGSFVKDVVVAAFPVKKGEEWERASGLVKARIEHEGQIFQDVLQIGKPFKLEWTTEKMAGGVSVKIKNPNRQTIEGAVALVTSPEVWAFGEPTFPREQGFAVPPNAELNLKFETGNLPAGIWQIARIAYNGDVEYQRADDK